MIEALDAAAIGRWSQEAVRSLEAHRAEIDGLNVYPVPDGDTGSNLVMTVRAGASALGAAGAGDAGAALAVFARGAVLGARGNSGVIISQFLRGLADAAEGAAACDATVLAAGLRLGAGQARDAVASPVEGTILSVADAAAAASVGCTDLPGLLGAAVHAAEQAVRLTTGQLPELAAAGVVDAGGQGFLVLLDALGQVVTGASVASAARRPAPISRAARESGSSDYEFEVQYLLDAPEATIIGLRAGLADIGDSVAVVGTGDGVWNVHAHVNDVGAAIETGVAAGRPHRITVVRFADVAIEPDGAITPDAAITLDGAITPDDGTELGPDDGRRPVTAVVAVAPGEGLSHLFEAEGVYVVDGSAASPPTAEQVLSAVRSAAATELVLLPNASHITGVAEAAAERARADGIRVAVVPTRSPVQGLAAVAVHNAAGRFEDNVVAMAEAAAATRYAEITIAQREALTSVGICQPGDVLGLIDGEVVEIGRGLVAVAFALVDRLLGVGAEIMTVLVGEAATPGIGGLVAGHVHERSPLTEVSVYAVGQPDHPLIIGVE